MLFCQSSKDFVILLQRTKQEHDLLVVGDQSDEVIEGVQNAKWITVKAVVMLLLGTTIAAAFADPLVDTVNNFSSATNIPKFLISFIALPLATNSSDAVFAVIFATKKKKTTASLALSEVCLVHIVFVLIIFLSASAQTRCKWLVINLVLLSVMIIT